jgi:putative RNA 2'-phosphotransferase
MSAELSRAVSHALRHEPWVYELELDEQGWVSVGSLVAALREGRGWSDLTADDVAAMVATSSKQRHEIDGDRIRAIYGHSIPARIVRTPAGPPPLLYHGTSPEAAAAILVDGLRPMARQYVHLSVDRAMARSVGSRKASEPTLLVVRADDAARNGVAFYTGNDKVWLADEVPAEFISAL